MSFIVVSPWGSTKPILAPSPAQQGQPEGSPGGAPGASEGGSRCDWCQLQLSEQGHRMGCGHHCCKECEQGSSRAGGRACLQCLEDQGKQLLNDLDRVHHGKVEDAESLLAPSHQRLLLEAVQGAQEARGRLDQRLSEVEAQQKTLQNIVTVLSREMGRRDGARGSADRGSANVLGEAMARILYLEEKVAQQDSLLAIKDVMISSLGAQVQALEQTSYDGHFLWRVPDVGRKLQQALSSQIPAVYSPPFYTSRYGYKLCLKVYLNGDGTGAGTHISLFLVLMRGEYDFRLKWPFRHKVTFTLLDQAGERHVSSSFQTADASSSFQRPVSKCNIASGLPEFFPLCRLHAPEATYIHEDTLAFEALINTSL
ncbi:TNF receptor-associated factor 1-like [Dermochelys coriacea]|uniref:TNF receptor-associated factor 1-like n=1 Tax=Dermochelys coriacea TaxID=27794 RepID=UPI001CA900E8|nr:TNF receptor-associated factor 1-like [Dermochelys coriacea]